MKQKFQEPSFRFLLLGTFIAACPIFAYFLDGVAALLCYGYWREAMARNHQIALTREAQAHRARY